MHKLSIVGAGLAFTAAVAAQDVYPDSIFVDQYGDDDSFHFFSYGEQHIQLIFGDDNYPGKVDSYGTMDWRNVKYDLAAGYSDNSRYFNAEIHVDHHDWSVLSPTFTINFASGSPTLVHTASVVWGDYVSPPDWVHDWGDRDDLTQSVIDDAEFTFAYNQGPFLFNSAANPGLGIISDFQIRGGQELNSPGWNPQRNDYHHDGMQFGPQPNDWTEGTNDWEGDTGCYRQGYNGYTWCEAHLRTYGGFPWIDASYQNKYVLEMGNANLPATTLTGQTLVALSLGFLSSSVDPAGTPWADSCQDVWIDTSLLVAALFLDVTGAGDLVWDPITMGGSLAYDVAYLGFEISTQASFDDIHSVKQLSGAGWSTAALPPIQANMARNYTPNSRIENPTSHTSNGSQFLFYAAVPNARWRN